MQRKLKLLLTVCTVPMIIMMIIFLLMTDQFSKRYDRIVSNITRANEYNQDFKEDMDYVMYIIAVNSERASELVDTGSPFIMIQQARTTFQSLRDLAEEPETISILQGILQSLDTLERQVGTIEADAQTVGMYETNLERLDFDIRIMTELIQEEIQDYISQEVKRLETLRTSVRADVERAIEVSISVMLIVLAAAIAISRLLMHQLTEGLRQIRIVSRKAGNGDFSVRAKVEDRDEELEELAQGFNQMVERLGDLVEDIRVEQKNLRLTEQKLLQAQINPHFLYNTLDAIIWLAESGEKEQVVTMVMALSDFFRTTLSKGRDYISVQEEEAHIKSYLQIQQFRYQDILEYEISIPEELYPYQILKLTLQPLVENALYHGIKNKRGLGRIIVTGAEDGDSIILKVKDNGIGMTPERLRQVRQDMNQNIGEQAEPEGFGLYNVAQRIRLNYGADYGMEINSCYGEGTEVTVRLPKR